MKARYSYQAKDGNLQGGPTKAMGQTTLEKISLDDKNAWKLHAVVIKLKRQILAGSVDLQKRTLSTATDR